MVLHLTLLQIGDIKNNKRLMHNIYNNTQGTPNATCTHIHGGAKTHGH